MCTTQWIINQAIHILKINNFIHKNNYLLNKKIKFNQVTAHMMQKIFMKTINIFKRKFRIKINKILHLDSTQIYQLIKTLKVLRVTC